LKYYKLSFKKGCTNACRLIGEYYEQIGDIKKMLNHYERGYKKKCCHSLYGLLKYYSQNDYQKFMELVRGSWYNPSVQWNTEISFLIGKTLYSHAEYAYAVDSLQYDEEEIGQIILARISYHMNDIPNMISHYEKAIEYGHENANSEILWYYVSINDIEKIQEFDKNYSITDFESSHMFVSLYKKNKNIDKMIEYYNKDITERRKMNNDNFDENTYTIPHKLIIGTYYAENGNLEEAFRYFDNVNTYIDSCATTNLSIYDSIFWLTIDDFDKLLTSLENVYQTFGIGDGYNYHVRYFTFLQRIYNNKYSSVYKHIIKHYIIKYCCQTMNTQNLIKYNGTTEDESKIQNIHFLPAKSMLDMLDMLDI